MIKVLFNYLHLFHLLSYTGFCTCIDTYLTMEEDLPCCEWAPADAQKKRFMVQGST